MRTLYRLSGIVLMLLLTNHLFSQESKNSAILSGKIVFEADSIYPLKPYSIILDKQWPITYKQYEQQRIDTTDYSFRIKMSLEELTYGTLIVNFFQDVDSTTREERGYWNSTDLFHLTDLVDGHSYLSRIMFSGVRFVIEPGDSLYLLVNYNKTDSIGRKSVTFTGTGASNNNLYSILDLFEFSSASFRMPLEEGLRYEDQLMNVKLEDLVKAKDSLSRDFYTLRQTDILFDNLSRKHALIRASLYDPDMNIEQKRARARKYYAFLDTLSLKPVYLNSTEFRSFLDYYLEYINRIVTGKDVPYDQNEKSSYLAKAIFDDELLKTFLFKRVGSQMDEPGFYKHRASQYTGFMEQFPNTPEAYRLRMIHKKRYPVSNGQPAPDLVLVDSLGRHTRLSHLKGKVVILTTYYPWQRKDPDLEERIEELRQAIGPDLVLVALGRRENGNRVFFHPLVDYYVNANSENRNLTLYEFPSSQSYSFIIRKNGIIEDCIYLLNISDQTINALKSEKYTLLTRLNNFGQEHTTEIIIILSLLFSMTLIFFLQSRLKARHQALMRKQLNSELKAIRSQLNPHFLFNSLNSLQNFINQSDTKTANLHLTKFSRLMRRIIELSEQESIPLQEELELNRTFIELEQLRYGFKCTFDIEEGIDLFNVEIPSMIIQPFIENAIVHAMAELGEQGELKIIVKEQGTDKIKVEILDNGKGFRAEGKHGFGLRSSRERIDLINSQSREKIDLYIESPSDKNAKKGTAVTLIIPKRI